MPTALFLFRIALAIWGLLWFPTNFRCFFLPKSILKNALGILMGIVLHLQTTLGVMGTFRILIFFY